MSISGGIHWNTLQLAIRSNKCYEMILGHIKLNLKERYRTVTHRVVCSMFLLSKEGQKRTEGKC